MRPTKVRKNTKRARRAQARYLAWLRLKDAWPDTTFLQFLTDPLYADARFNADITGG